MPKTAERRPSISASGLGAKILVVEDDQHFRLLYQDMLTPDGHTVVAAESPVDVWSRLNGFSPDIILLDLFFRQGSGMDAIPELLARFPQAKVLVVSAAEESEAALAAVRRGAYDFINKDEKDFSCRLRFRIAQTLETLHLQRAIDLEIESRGGYAFGEEVIVGTSAAMRSVYSLIDKVAVGGCSALISGESGTGKELVARAIHLKSRRRAGPFVSIDCGAIAKGVLESELFGVAKGYPGFHNRERLVGRLEAVGDGVLLLDEIGNMDVDLQIKLLRVLEEREFHSLGESKLKRLSAQLLASTNADLVKAAAIGRFRQDLFFRLNEVPIVLPPLRDRMDDLPLLVEHLLAQHNRRTRADRRVTSDAIEKLMGYHWPGNVRELQKTLDRALILTDRRFVTDTDIQLAVQPSAKKRDALTPASLWPPDSAARPLKEAEEAFRKAYVEDVVRQTEGDWQKAAVILGIDTRTIRRILSSS